MLGLGGGVPSSVYVILGLGQVLLSPGYWYGKWVRENSSRNRVIFFCTQRECFRFSRNSRVGANLTNW